MNNDNVNDIMRLTYILCFTGALAGSIITPSYIRIQSMVDPSILSLILIIPMIIKMAQGQLSRLSHDLSLTLPIYLVIFDIGSVFTILISPIVFIISDTIICIVSTMLLINRSNIIIEKIKHLINIRVFQNNMMTYGAIGSIIGFLTSSVLCNMLQPTTIVLVTGILSSVVYIPYVKINALVR